MEKGEGRSKRKERISMDERHDKWKCRKKEEG